MKINLNPAGNDFTALSKINLPGAVQIALTWVLVIAAIIFFFMLVIGGIKWILSGGDKQQTEGARNQITAALVGLVIVFSAWAIAKLLGYFFNISIFDDPQFNLPQVPQT